MNSTLAPIVLFCYNRPKHTELTLTALSENTLADQSELFVFCDGPKLDVTAEQLNKIQQVRGFVKSKNWCGKVTVFESLSNKGLANSVIEGVTKIVNEFGRVIVLEDDLVTSKGFLKYMNTALDKYKSENDVYQISGYCYPTDAITKNGTSFFLPITTSWGWGTWDRAWACFDKKVSGYEVLKNDKELATKFNLDNSYPLAKMLFEQMETKSIDSWVIRWWWSVFNKNGLTLFPDKSLVKNIGFGIEGTHTLGNNPFPIVDFDSKYFIVNFPSTVIANDEYFKLIKLTLKNYTISVALTRNVTPSIIGRILNKLSRLFIKTN